MSVTDPVDGELYVVRIHKGLSSNPARTWVNTYEFRNKGGASVSDLLGIMSGLVTFEQHISVTSTLFLRGAVSTWAPDSKPYDPTAFISTTLTASGIQSDTGNQLPLQTCLSVSRDVLGGRLGHLFFRNFLRENDTSSPAGVSKLDDRAGIQTQLDAAIDAAGLLEFIAPGGSGALQMVLVNKDGTNVRDVYQLRVAGVAQVPINHKWYNRTSGPVVTG